MAEPDSDKFVPETEEDDDVENNEAEAKMEVDSTKEEEKEGEAQASSSAGGNSEEDFTRRCLNGKWYGCYATTNQFMEYDGAEWQLVKDEDLEFVQQLWFEQDAAEHTVVDGVKLKWNHKTNQWERDEVDEDFIAQYQLAYGVSYDYDKMTEEFRKQKEAEAAQAPPVEEKKKKKDKNKPPEPAPEGWVDLDAKVNAVYVSNLPTDITLEEFQAFMTKCGIIQNDARTHKPKIKLYTDDEGNNKGDGRCVYIRPESVEMALNILDGAQLNGKVVKVERAHFEQKGEYNPALKRKKMTPAQKKAYMERQKKLFEWKPDKPRNYRPLSDCTVIIKHLFTLKMIDENAALILDLKEELEKSCAKFGTVKKVVIYENNPEGVASVQFENTTASDQAVKMMNGHVIGGRQLVVHLWDGRTKYKVEETEEEKQRRIANWENFIEGEKSKEQEQVDRSSAPTPPPEELDEEVPSPPPADEDDGEPRPKSIRAE